MKIILLLLVYLLSVNILSTEQLPIMLEIKSKLDIPKEFRDGIEESVTGFGYILINEEEQKRALQEQVEQSKNDCIDDSCLVDTGKMLAAKAIIIINVFQVDENEYKFKVRYIDFETGTTQKTTTLFYKKSIKDYKSLFVFSKKLISKLLKKEEKNKKNNRKWISVELNTKLISTNFSFQKRSANILTGITMKLLPFSFGKFNIHILSFGIYKGLDSFNMFTFSLINTELNVFNNFYLKIAIGPVLGEYFNIYDNQQDNFISYAGASVIYRGNINNRFYWSTELSSYYGAKNSKESFYSLNNAKSDNKVETGFINSFTISAGLNY